MATFITDLFQSIFTPGPTSSLLVATNAAFACLQLTLLLLLIGTYSVHFLILSFLSAGLWWAINWFVAELRIVEAAEKEKQRKAEELGSGDDSETEAETVIETKGASGSREVEVTENLGVLKPTGAGGHSGNGSRSEHSTEDEWEKLSENEKDK